MRSQRIHGRPAGRRSTRLARARSRACLPMCHARWRCLALRTAPRRFARYPALPARTASAAKREGPQSSECRSSGARASWLASRCNRASGPVERLLRETVRASGWSAAIAVYGNHRMPHCVQGAFFAYFLCTSKESESAAGPKPPPALQANNRQKHRAAHATRGKPPLTQQAASSAKSPPVRTTHPGETAWPGSRPCRRPGSLPGLRQRHSP